MLLNALPKLLRFSLICFSSLPLYAQVAADPIMIIAPDPLARSALTRILTKSQISWQLVDQANTPAELPDRLHIIAGSLTSCAKLTPPKNYIFLHTTNLSRPPTAAETDFLAKAIAIWDMSWANINLYKATVHNYLYLPNEHYAFLDPVVLACQLPSNTLAHYRELLIYSNSYDSDISSHLPTLFCHIMHQQPKFMVEAGVRGGDGSTIPMVQAAQLLKAQLVGIDIEDTGAAYQKIVYSGATFLQLNDLEFPTYFKTHYPKHTAVDFIFIDTSHTHEQTYQEIKAFSTILAPNGTLAFHDSNVTPLFNNTGYVRLNRTTGKAYGNPRGVTSAIKTYFGITFDEQRFVRMDFVQAQTKWHLVHYPFCNGLTLITKLT